MAAEPRFNPSTGRLDGVEPMARPTRNGRNGNGRHELPVEKPPRLKVITDDGQAVTVGEEVDPRELAMRLASEVEELRRKVENAENALRDAERELVQYRAKVRRLENDKQRERHEYVKRAEVEKAIDHWRVLTGHEKSRATADRFDAVRARLEEGFTVRTIDFGAFYFKRFPFTSKQGRQPHGVPRDRHDDIELLCRHGSKLENWARLGYRLARSEGFVFPWDGPEETA